MLKIEYRDRQLKGAEFERFIDIVWEGLKSPSLDYSVLKASVSYLAGSYLDDEVIEEFAHRLAGNLPLLRRFMPVLPWKYQRYAEWVPVQILDMRRTKNTRKEVGVLVTMKIMAGTACPRVLVEWWSVKKCRYLSRLFGFSRPNSVNAKEPALFLYAVPEELTTLRFLGLLEPDLCVTEPVISQIDMAPSLLAWNRSQLRLRVRKGFDCPQNFPKSFPCHRCVFGYLNCPAGTHRHDYEIKPCPVCKQEQAPWDPTLPVAMCLQCYTNALYKKG